MRLCFATNSLTSGGKERVLAELAHALAALPGVETHVVIYGRNRDCFFSLAPSIQIHRPRFEFSEKNRALDALRSARFLRRAVQAISPSVVISLGEVWNSFILAALSGLDVPVLISDRSQPGKPLGWMQERLRGAMYPRAAGFIAQTEMAARQARERGFNRNISVIGNPIRAPVQRAGIEKENIVLTVGRLIPTKHIEDLIKTFARIDVPNWRLVVVGGDVPGQHRLMELRTMIEREGLQNRISLEGTQSDVDTYYQRARLFAFSSSSEGFPNVVGEALAAGLPVVTFDCVAGPAEMVVDGVNGFLVPVHDWDMLRNRLAQLMTDDLLRQRMARAAPGSVERFASHQIARQFLDFALSV